MSKDIVYWTMRNGKKISVDDMDIDHLRNTLKMILRNRGKQKSVEPVETDEWVGFDPVWDIYMK